MQNLVYFSHMMALASGSRSIAQDSLSPAKVRVQFSLCTVKEGPNLNPRAFMYFLFFLTFLATIKMSVNRKIPHFFKTPPPEAKQPGPRATMRRSLFFCLARILLAPGSMFWTSVTDNWFSFFNFGSLQILSRVFSPNVATLSSEACRTAMRCCARFSLFSSTVIWRLNEILLLWFLLLMLNLRANFTRFAASLKFFGLALRSSCSGMAA